MMGNCVNHNHIAHGHLEMHLNRSTKFSIITTGNVCGNKIFIFLCYTLHTLTKPCLHVHLHLCHFIHEHFTVIIKSTVTCAGPVLLLDNELHFITFCGASSVVQTDPVNLTVIKAKICYVVKNGHIFRVNVIKSSS